MAALEHGCPSAVDTAAPLVLVLPQIRTLPANPVSKFCA